MGIKEGQKDVATQVFDAFCHATTLRGIMNSFHQLCDVLSIDLKDHHNLYWNLRSKLTSWKAKSLWVKLDKRVMQKEYQRGMACANTRVLVIGGGPCGLRTAIEIALLGGKCVVLEKRDRLSRNNVLHLWPFIIHDLKSLGGKRFYGKFCAGAIDHISIRQLQCILLKAALVFGVEIHINTSFEGLLEPSEERNKEKVGWRAVINPKDHPVSEYEFDVLVGADGRRNTLDGFKRKEFRGKLAIGITANFINWNTNEEASVEEISGVAFIFNQKFFKDLKEETGIDLENIVYYKDETHYFVMTAKKQSLLEKGVLLRDHQDVAFLLSRENVNQEALLAYAKEAADVSTNHQLPVLEYAKNHYGQADVAMFDFTSLFAAENASRLVQRRGYKLLTGLVGDSLLEPFWPTGSGCARGFLGSMDFAWMVRSFASGSMTPLEVIAERESIYQLLSQTTPMNLNKDLNQYSIDPRTRYPNLNIGLYKPHQVRELFDCDDVAYVNEIVEIPSKRRKSREFMGDYDRMLKWYQKQLDAYKDMVRITDLSSSWKSGLAFCALIHRFRPDMIDMNSLPKDNDAQVCQKAFDVFENECGIPPIMTGPDMAVGEKADKLSLWSYLSQLFDYFKGDKINGKAADMLSPEDAPSLRTRTPSQRLHLLSKFNKMHRRNRENKDKENAPKAPVIDYAESPILPSSSYTRKRQRELADVDHEDQVKKYTIAETMQEAQDTLGTPPGNMEVGIRGHNKVSDLADRLFVNPREYQKIEQPEKKGIGFVHDMRDKLFPQKQGEVTLGFEESEQYQVKRTTGPTPFIGNMAQKLFGGPEEEKERPPLQPQKKNIPGVGGLVSTLLNYEDKTVNSDMCYFCHKRVYIMERISAEGYFFHRGCLRCDYCNTILRLGTYAFKKNELGVGKFYCFQHLGLEKKHKRKLSYEERQKNLQEVKAKISALSPKRTPVHPSFPPFRPERQTSSPKDEIDGVPASFIPETPERVEFENSIDDMEGFEEIEVAESLRESLSSRGLEESDEEESSEGESSSEEDSDEDFEVSSLDEEEYPETWEEACKLADSLKKKKHHEESDEGTESEDIDVSDEYTDEEEDEDEEIDMDEEEEDEAEVKDEVKEKEEEVSPRSKEKDSIPTSRAKADFFTQMSQPVRIDPWAFFHRTGLAKKEVVIIEKEESEHDPKKKEVRDEVKEKTGDEVEKEQSEEAEGKLHVDGNIEESENITLAKEQSEKGTEEDQGVPKEVKGSDAMRADAVQTEEIEYMDVLEDEIVDSTGNDADEKLAMNIEEERKKSGNEGTEDAAEQIGVKEKDMVVCGAGENVGERKDVVEEEEKGSIGEGNDLIKAKGKDVIEAEVGGAEGKQGEVPRELEEMGDVDIEMQGELTGPESGGEVKDEEKFDEQVDMSEVNGVKEEMDIERNETAEQLDEMEVERMKDKVEYQDRGSVVEVVVDSEEMIRGKPELSDNSDHLVCRSDNTDKICEEKVEVVEMDVEENANDDESKAVMMEKFEELIHDLDREMVVNVAGVEVGESSTDVDEVDNNELAVNQPSHNIVLCDVQTPLSDEVVKAFSEPCLCDSAESNTLGAKDDCQDDSIPLDSYRVNEAFVTTREKKKKDRKLTDSDSSFTVSTPGSSVLSLEKERDDCNQDDISVLIQNQSSVEYDGNSTLDSEDFNQLTNSKDIKISDLVENLRQKDESGYMETAAAAVTAPPTPGVCVVDMQKDTEKSAADTANLNSIDKPMSADDSTKRDSVQTYATPKSTNTTNDSIYATPPETKSPWSPGRLRKDSPANKYITPILESYRQPKSPTLGSSLGRSPGSKPITVREYTLRGQGSGDKKTRPASGTTSDVSDALKILLGGVGGGRNMTAVPISQKPNNQTITEKSVQEMNHADGTHESSRGHTKIRAEDSVDARNTNTANSKTPATKQTTDDFFTPLTSFKTKTDHKVSDIEEEKPKVRKCLLPGLPAATSQDLGSSDEKSKHGLPALASDPFVKPPLPPSAEEVRKQKDSERDKIREIARERARKMSDAELGVNTSFTPSKLGRGSSVSENEDSSSACTSPTHDKVSLKDNVEDRWPVSPTRITTQKARSSSPRELSIKPTSSAPTSPVKSCRTIDGGLTGDVDISTENVSGILNVVQKGVGNTTGQSGDVSVKESRTNGPESIPDEDPIVTRRQTSVGSDDSDVTRRPPKRSAAFRISASLNRDSILAEFDDDSDLNFPAVKSVRSPGGPNSPSTEPSTPEGPQKPSKKCASERPKSTEGATSTDEVDSKGGTPSTSTSEGKPLKKVKDIKKKDKKKPPKGSEGSEKESPVSRQKDAPVVKRREKKKMQKSSHGSELEGAVGGQVDDKETKKERRRSFLELFKSSPKSPEAKAEKKEKKKEGKTPVAPPRIKLRTPKSKEKKDERKLRGAESDGGISERVKELNISEQSLKKMVPSESQETLSGMESDSGKKAAQNAKKIQLAARRQQRQRQLKRLRMAQEIQRQLEEIEVKQRDMEQRGVVVEQALRGEGPESHKPEKDLMQEWFNLIHEKNALVRFESELMITARELELEDRQGRLEDDLRERMSNPDEKTKEQEAEEKKVLDELLEVVDQRNSLVALLEEDRLKQQKEDEDLESVMTKKGFQLSPISFARQNIRAQFGYS